MKCTACKKDNSKKRKPSSWSNIRRFFKYSRASHSAWLWHLLGAALLSAFISFMMVMIPRWILMQIKGDSTSFLQIFVFIASVEAGLFMLKCVRDYFRGKSKLSAECLFRKAYADLSVKQATISYVDALKKESIDSLEGGKYGVWAGPQITTSLEMMGSSAMSMVVDAVIIASFDWRLLVIPIAVNFVLIPFYRKVRDLEINNAKRLRPENRAFGWYCKIISDFQYGKDLRIYQSQAFILEKCRKLMKSIFIVNQESFTRKGILLGIVKALLQLQIVVVDLLTELSLWIMGRSWRRAPTNSLWRQKACIAGCIKLRQRDIFKGSELVGWQAAVYCAKMYFTWIFAVTKEAVRVKEIL